MKAKHNVKNTEYTPQQPLQNPNLPCHQHTATHNPHIIFTNKQTPGGKTFIYQEATSTR